MTFSIKRPWLRRLIIGGAWSFGILIIVLIIAIAYFDWSAARRLAAAKRMLAQAGISLDIHSIGPDPVPDDQNFCAIPALKDLALATRAPDDKSELGRKYQRLMNAFILSVPGGTMPPKLPLGPRVGKAADMKAWADWLREAGMPPAPPKTGNPGRDVLSALSRDDGLFRELAAGLNRPESEWTPPWSSRPVPPDHLGGPMAQYEATQRLVFLLSLRAAAAAQAGDAATAHQSLLIALRLNQASIPEPYLINAFVACGYSNVISGGVWEVCRAHAGTADDFRRLQQALQKLDYRQCLLHAERGEATYAMNLTEYLERSRSAKIFTPIGLFGLKEESPIASVEMRAIPRGLFDANAATMAQWQMDYLISPLQEGGFVSLLAKQKELLALIQKDMRAPLLHLDEILPALAMGAWSHVAENVVSTQAVVNQAIAACALERYRIEHGSYPNTLVAANHPGEKPIPLDVLSGKQMGYRKTPDGRYLLWCVSFSGIDHGGKRVLDKDDPEHTKFSSPTYQGDWVWSYSPD
jgi:hypothetical protein